MRHGKGAADGNTIEPESDARRQRKKLQNRSNQRARRLREKERNGECSSAERRPFKVTRWRLGEDEHTQSSCGPKLQGRSSALNRKGREDHAFRLEHLRSLVSTDSAVPARSNPRISLSADHLIRLVQHNTFRGLYLNKMMLNRLAACFVQGPEGPEMLDLDEIFPSYSIILPVSPTLPDCLTPTDPQMKVVHATWIDLLPFPRMRENLIRRETSFNHSEFVLDLVGSYIDIVKYPDPGPMQAPAEMTRVTLSQGDDDEITASRHGLIVWGEPHEIQSWEATPGFVRKWPWAMEGCTDLINSSNRWRMSRGEGPMQLFISI
ncbi:hypothetical protein G7046_g469 [Stylonectria norvegica]|nr:hypothetical protein G7046_g469 [Stylonectria norvegica]